MNSDSINVGTVETPKIMYHDSRTLDPYLAVVSTGERTGNTHVAVLGTANHYARSQNLGPGRVLKDVS